jgi:hypothetical protein
VEDDKYFVTVIAASEGDLKALAHKGLDLFQPTARRQANDVVIEGLLKLDEIGQLVRAGYRVTVDATAESRSRAASETTTLDEWLQAMGE